MIDFTRRFSFHDVVIVADCLDDAEECLPAEARRDLEMTEAATLSSLQNAITALGLTHHHYPSPAALADNAALHTQDIVLSIYGGRASRNRMALVPAVCETFGLKFIGPDVFGRIVAQDKEISKRLAIDYGILTPAWRVVREPADLGRIGGLRMPVVVKPFWEGSSIGISQRNLLSSLEGAHATAARLLEQFGQPVIIEEFVSGREVSYCKIEHVGESAWAFCEVVIDGDPTFFASRLFDAEEKQNPSPGRGVRNIDSELLKEDRDKIETFLAAFTPYGYCRVDGRLFEGRFHFLEITPDAWIAPKGQFARGFTEKGWTYETVIAAVLASAG
jgi:D-alanine-D-alanine ligase